MIEELDRLIIKIEEEYKNINEQWEKNELYSQINLKKQSVKNIYESNYIFQDMLNYRRFITIQNIPLVIELQNFNINNSSNIETRVKTQNSIELKMQNYMDKYEKGEVPIIKCFNDLFGMRVIYDNCCSHEEIEEFIKNKYPNLKCIPAIRGEYIATHLYFKESNYSYPWELRIWDKKNEKKNKLSHEIYKQSYTKWEAENIGGKI